MNEYFSATYSDARAKFLSACLDVKATVRSYQNPERGSAGESLFTDTTWIGPDNAPNVVVVTSSTHGVEGFAGSAVQVPNRPSDEPAVPCRPGSVGRNRDPLRAPSREPTREPVAATEPGRRPIDSLRWGRGLVVDVHAPWSLSGYARSVDLRARRARDPAAAPWPVWVAPRFADDWPERWGAGNPCRPEGSAPRARTSFHIDDRERSPGGQRPTLGPVSRVRSGRKRFGNETRRFSAPGHGEVALV